jgi:hypothetical protein
MALGVSSVKNLGVGGEWGRLLETSLHTLFIFGGHVKVKES